MFPDSYVLCIYVMNILCTFHVAISWVWYMTTEAEKYADCTFVTSVLGMILNCIWWRGFGLGAIRMWRTPSLPFVSGPLWSGVMVPVRVQSISQIELLSNNLQVLIYPKPLTNRPTNLSIYLSIKTRFWMWLCIHVGMYVYMLDRIVGRAENMLTVYLAEG